MTLSDVSWDIPIRLALGVIFMGHGCRKLWGWFGGKGLQGTAKEFEALGLKPASLMAMLAGSGQLLGALLVLLGFLTKIGAGLIFVEIFMGLFVAHLKNGFFLNWDHAPNKGHGIEYNLAIIAMTIPLIIWGSGSLSLDVWLRGVRP